MPSSAGAGGKKGKRDYLSQTDVPSVSLDEAMRVPRAIFENYGGDPTPPIQVASAMDLTPGSGHFRTICGAAIAYGLTEGGPRAPEISLSPLARRALKPLEDGDDSRARQEALLQPRVVHQFLEKYNGSPLPRTEIAYNVLESMGVPADKTESVLQLILEGAKSAGFLLEIKGKPYVDLSTAPARRVTGAEAGDGEPEHEVRESEGSKTDHHQEQIERPLTPAAAAGPSDIARRRRVFITHGKNKEFLEPIKKLLAFGEMEPMVAAETQSVSKPVPDKVLEAMRSCGAAIIHVDAEQRLIDSDAKEQIVLNPNVLIEIGAAMALYGRRFILLVRDGITLPSNLQGLYEVRYAGPSLDGNATIKLLEAINDIKKNPLPE